MAVKKHIHKVVYIFETNDPLPVITVNDEYSTTSRFGHAAEIEEKRMTNHRFASWLREDPEREYKFNDDHNIVRHTYNYEESTSFDPVPKNILVRENAKTAWHIPIDDYDYEV